MRNIAATDETIRSRHNARLKDLRQRLLRPGYITDGLIAIEGEHLLLEAARSGLRIEAVFVREGRNFPEDSPRLEDLLTFTVAAEAFDHACATESPQGIAAIIAVPQWSLDSLLRETSPRIVVLAGLQDPGNAGTIVRSAEAFGASGVLLTPGNVHPWNQKMLRASAGSSFRIPVISVDNAAVLGRLQEKSIPVYACAAQSGDSIVDAKFEGSWAFVIGNEGAGIPDDVRRFCSHTVHIPYSGPVESLNAGMAASIILYEAARQRTAVSVRSKS